MVSEDPEYDPVARRERYLRDRELKGRGKGPTPVGNVGTHQPKKSGAEADAKKDAISKENKAKSKKRAAVSSQKNKEMAKLQASLNEQRNRIVNQLKEALNSLTSQAEEAEKGRIKERDAKLAKIAADREAKLASVPDIPSNARGKFYEQQMQRRIEAIRRIKGEAAEKTSAVNSAFSKSQAEADKDLQTKKRFVSEVTQARKEQLQTQLKGTIDNAKERYDTLLEALKPTEQED
jgi:hypothetical protein